MKIAITYPFFGAWGNASLERLKAAGLEPVVIDLKPDYTDLSLIQSLAGCAGIIAGDEKYTSTIFEALPSIKVIARCAPSLEGIDLEAAKEQGVTVFISHDAHVASVAEFVLGGIFTLLRNYPAMNYDVRHGNWRQPLGSTLAGKQVGIIGFGRVGRAVAERCLALGCKVSFHDPFVESIFTLESGQQLYNVPFVELLSGSDIVSLHCPHDASENPLFGDAELRTMPEGAILINTAHGGLVDEASLYAAVNTGRLSGAIMDVFAKEPYTGPLTDLDKVLLTPHAAASTKECRLQMEQEAVEAVLTALGVLPAHKA